MFSGWMSRSMAVLLFGLVAVVRCEDPETRSLAERIAFACEHKPTLSFCGSKSERRSAFATVSTVDSAREASVLTPQDVGSRRADLPISQGDLKTSSSAAADGFSLQPKRHSDSPTPKRRLRWVFVPHSGPGGDSRFWEDLAKSARSSSTDFIEQKERRESKEPREPKEPNEPLLIVPPEPYADKQRGTGHTRALQSRTFPVLPSDAAYGAGQVQASNGNPFSAFDSLTDEASALPHMTYCKGLAHRPRSRSPFTKPGLWEPNPDDPHSRDPANKYWYKPESVGVDWLNGQLQWGGHWAVPAAGVGGTNGQSTLHFPSIGTFLGIPDDYD